MGKKRKVGFATKLLSNHYFLNEVQVEGKAARNNDQYAAQIIRTGNCITLLSNHFKLTDDSFWNTNYFSVHYLILKKLYVGADFRAYLQYSGNSIVKLKTFISEFRNENNYIKHSEVLKKVKIKKLS